MVSSRTILSSNYHRGISTKLRNEGWQLLSDRPLNMSNASNVAPGSVGGIGGVLGATVRWRHRALFAADHIVLVFGNFTSDNSATENPGLCTIKVKASLQKNGGSGLTDETGVRIPVTFRGSYFGEVPPDGLLFSDPIPFDVALNELFFVRCMVTAPGTGYKVPALQENLGGSNNFEGINNGEGVGADDMVLGSATVTQNSQQNTFGPLAVMGFNSSPQKSVALFGDSIGSGTGDGGYYSHAGGYMQRVMTNLTNLAIDTNWATNTIANFAHVKCAKFGATLASFASRATSYKELKLAELATTAIWQLGINDTSTTLGAMQANALIVANWFTARGIKIIWCTLLPYTTSTDNWKTAANQTVRSNEAVRTGFNSWLRDTSGSGFKAQVNAPGLVDVWDAAASIEVDATNTPTLNGGFWPSAVSINDLSGTLSSVQSIATVTDNSKSPAKNTYRGYALLMTSGAANGSAATILSQTTGGQFALLSSLISLPSAGDSYLIYRPYTFDGLHPTSIGHQAIANALNTAGPLAMVI